MKIKVFLELEKKNLVSKKFLSSFLIAKNFKYFLKYIEIEKYIFLA